MIQNAATTGTNTRGPAAAASGSVAAASSFRTGHGKASASSRASSGSVERLDIGRRVAFKVPHAGRMEAAQWILATVKAFLPPNKYAPCLCIPLL